MGFNLPSTLSNLTLWGKWESARIGSLSDQDVLKELKSIMNGHNYSWYTISQRLKRRLAQNLLTLEHFESGNIPYEWNVLCDERLSWQRQGRPSFVSFGFNRACLINLKLIPTLSGLGYEGEKLVTKNVDFIFWADTLVLDYPIRQGEDFRGKNGYYYAEGPEFRIEYIHNRVE